ncbi:hypothetical protein A8950_2128 [Dongia mobilis]|uniref:Uncharacterized protein n=1 Tax=Dongia mobilis TaxID=578943 RepID=A0A4R6WR66_9PROT|nr:hypothetical protein [Dongia mobilis]TDQ82306.1 hypothetical protein A8950_2128 [Dongia mobilis]
MDSPSQLRPGLYGALIGCIVTLSIGFTVGGWYLGSTAETLANARSKVAVIEALVPICVSYQQVDPNSSGKLAELSAMKTAYEQRDFVMKAGWATMPATDAPNRELAAACASALARSAAG